MSSFLAGGLSVLAQSSLLLLLGLSAAWLLRRRGPMLRAFVLQMTLAGVALGAVLSVGLDGRIQPLWTVPLPAVVQRPLSGASASPSPKDGRGSGVAASPSFTFRPASVPFAPRMHSSLPLSGTGRVDRLAGTGGVLSVALVSVWATGSAVLLLWLAVCQWHLSRLRRSASLITHGPAADMLARLSAARRLEPPLLLTSPHVHSPFLEGIVCPAIFLPASWEADYDEMALQVVLAHELAHHARRDCAWTLLLRLTTALLCMQPLLWLLGRQLEQATEEACDLFALSPDLTPRRYADSLLMLAEHTLPSPRERTLGAGVVPFRSALGQRIQAILIARHIAPMSRYCHVGAGIVMGMVLFAILVAVGTAAPEPAGFGWAKAQGWPVRPVQTLSLDPLVASPEMPQPAEYGAANRRLISQCQTDSAPALHHILIVHPHFFYAEYCLAVWDWNHHDQGGYWAWLKAALRDAPAVLAGRVVLDGGTPVTGFEFSTEIDCYSQSDRLERHSLPLDFQAVVTNAEGCYYLPVAHALYSQNGIGWRPNELQKQMGNIVLETDELPLSGTITEGSGPQLLNRAFAATTRVGTLPDIFVRPVVQWNAPFQAAATSSDVAPLLLHGSSATISWKPYPRAVCYTATLYEDHCTFKVSKNGQRYAATTLSIPVPLGDPLFGNGTAHTWFNLHLSGRYPAFDRHLRYSLVVYAHSTNSPASSDVLSSSIQCTFQPTMGLAPQPLTKASFAQAIGPGTIITTIKSTQDGVTVTGTTPQDINNLPPDFGSLWGLRWAAGRNTGGNGSYHSFTITFTR